MNCSDFVLLQNEAVSAEPLVPLQSCQFLQLVRRRWICKQNLHIFQTTSQILHDHGPKDLEEAGPHLAELLALAQLLEGVPGEALAAREQRASLLH